MTQSNCNEQESMIIEDFSTNPPPGLHFPTCNATSRPYVGKTFDTELDGIEFNKFYAKECGFEVRLGTTSKSKDGTIRIRYVLCNRQGIWEYADEQLYDPATAKSKKRKTTSCRADCDAKMILQITTGGRYYIRVFIEGHTHSMVPGPSRHLMPSNRNVGEFPQMLIESGIKANIGPMRTFRMYREIVGNYDELGCTSDDFKNYVRDLKVYSKDSDAHMLLEAFSNKQELGGFKFFIDLDEEKKLQRLIWTDEHAVKNYKLFGEAVSFDATYGINR
ncbi:protein FAR1-RELATED SEQUENCE 5-like [Salvia miltiorrhiza]|uniref:protein FAR1-RELATED SEQUENCE 5-like n=1 Tax=Salvia miltiorrhiza TaxID=226208 RepID=UPI0025AC4FEF|nr:protein FAR1-RELATED SEQUENCE 5-like [Salvia miltiorrhiza]